MMSSVDVQVQSKSIIKTVLERCQKEKHTNRLQIPLDDCEERVAYYTGFPKSYIFKLCDEGQVTEEDLDLFSRIKILKLIRDLCLRKEVVSYTVLHSILVNRVQFHNLTMTQLQQHMHSLGYSYKKTNKFYTLVENPKLTFERFNYLNKIRNQRSKGSPIFYIDQRLIDFNLKFKKPSQEKTLVLLHMISRNGYNNGLFCYQPSPQDYMKWIVDIIIPMLPSASTVVMNRNAIFETDDKSITGYSTKSDMFSWLRKNNIPCEANMRKAELYELVKKCSFQVNKTRVERILQVHGHTVLHLPSKFYDLSATAVFWADVKTNLPSSRISHITQQTVLKQMVYDTISSLNNNKFMEYEQIIVNAENDIFSADADIEQAFENHYHFETGVNSCNCDNLQDIIIDK